MTHSIATLGFVLGPLLFFGAIPAHAAWTEPGQIPPGGNVAAPLNVSSVAQTKDGSLTAKAPDSSIFSFRGLSPTYTGTDSKTVAGIWGEGSKATRGASDEYINASAAVYGVGYTGTGGTGQQIGLLGVAGNDSSNSYGIYGWDGAWKNAYAGFFRGRVSVEGDVEIATNPDGNGSGLLSAVSLCLGGVCKSSWEEIAGETFFTYDQAPNTIRPISPAYSGSNFALGGTNSTNAAFFFNIAQNSGTMYAKESIVVGTPSPYVTGDYVCTENEPCSSSDCWGQATDQCGATGLICDPLGVVEGCVDVLVPTAPSNLSQNGEASYNVAHLQWSPSIDMGGGGLREYWAYRCNASSVPNCTPYDANQPNQNKVGVITASEDQTTVPFDDTSVEGEITYSYQVIAVDNYNNRSTPSNTLNVTTPPVPPPTAPTVVLTATPDTVNQGSASVLAWDSSNATSLSIDQGVGVVTMPSGTTTVSPPQTTTYTITATGDGGQATATATVTVPIPTVTLSALPSTIIEGNSARLSWTSTNADTLSIDQGIGNVPAPSGNRNVAPGQTTTYTITATKGTATAQASVTVTVELGKSGDDLPVLQSAPNGSIARSVPALVTNGEIVATSRTDIRPLAKLFSSSQRIFQPFLGLPAQAAEDGTTKAFAVDPNAARLTVYQGVIKVVGSTGITATIGREATDTISGRTGSLITSTNDIFLQPQWNATQDKLARFSNTRGLVDFTLGGLVNASEYCLTVGANTSCITDWADAGSGSDGTVTDVNAEVPLTVDKTNPQVPIIKLTWPLDIGYGGTGASNAATARANLVAAKSGENADITKLTGMTTPLSVSQGGTGTGTAFDESSVVFTAPGSTYAQDAGNFVYVPATHQLGIGLGSSVAPDASLDLGGQIKIRGGSPGANKVLTSDANGLGSWSTINATGGVTGSGTANTLPKWGAASGTLVDSTVVDDGTGVGIGTASSASYKLTVAGKINASTDFCINGDCVDSWSDLIRNQTGSQGAANFNIDGSGRVGTTLTVDTTLELPAGNRTTLPNSIDRGGTLNGNAYTSRYVFGADGASSSEYFGITSSNNAGNPIFSLSDDRNVHLGSTGAGNASSLCFYGSGSVECVNKKSDLGGAFSGSINTGQVAYGTDTDQIGGEDNLFWDAATNKLGIGKSPGFTLDVLGADGNGTIAKFARGGSEKPLYISSVWESDSYISSEGNIRLRTNVPADNPLGPGAVEAVMIDTGGNVGIGTTKLGQKLDVSGWGRFEGTGASNRDDSGAIEFYNNFSSSVNVQAQIKGLRGVGDFKAGQLGFFTAAAETGTLSERMTIDETGNVGIGTTMPNYKVDLGYSNNSIGGIGRKPKLALIRNTSSVNGNYDALVTNGIIEGTNEITAHQDSTAATLDSLDYDIYMWDHTGWSAGDYNPESTLYTLWKKYGRNIITTGNDTAASIYPIKATTQVTGGAYASGGAADAYHIITQDYRSNGSVGANSDVTTFLTTLAPECVSLYSRPSPDTADKVLIICESDSGGIWFHDESGFFASEGADALGFARRLVDYMAGSSAKVLAWRIKNQGVKHFQDNNTFFVDPYNARVGIGTTVPNSSLEIVPSGGAAVGKGLRLSNGSGGHSWELQAGSPSVNNDHFTLTDITASNAVRLTVDDTGNVGIGQPSPSSTLDVNGTITTTGFKLTTGAAASKVLTSNASGVGTWQDAPATGAPTDAEYIVAVANGTLTAERTLEGTANRVTVDNTQAGKTILSGPQDIHATASPAFAGLNLSGLTTNGPIYTSGGNGLLNAEAQLAVSRGGTGTGTYTKGDLLYSNEENSLAKLGIGSSSQILSVAAGGIPEWKTPNWLTTETDTLALVTGRGATTNTAIAVGGSVDTNYAITASTLGMKSTSTSSAANQPGGYFSNTGGGYGLLVDQGNVGIGTTSPGSLLHVYSTESVFGTIEGTQAGIDVGLLIKNNSGTGQQWALRGANDGRFMVRNDTVGNEAVTILSGGNVGIGTESPSSKLDVKNTTTGSAIRATVTDGVGSSDFGYGFYIDNTEHELAQVNAAYQNSADGGYGDLLFKTRNAGSLTEKMRIKADGNVGIGTPTPDTNSKLEVSGGRLKVTGTAGGSIRISGAEEPIAQGLRITDGPTGSGLAVSGNPLRLNWDALAGSPIIFADGAGAERMRVDAGGSVGIGKIDPSSALDVNGTITTTGFKLTTGAGLNKVLTSSTDGVGTWEDAPATGAPSDAAYLVAVANDSLSAERILQGTTNQINVADNAGAGTFTLSTPQNIHTAASPTFAGLNLSSLTASKGVFTDALKNITTTGTLGIGQGGTNNTSYTASKFLVYNNTSSKIESSTYDNTSFLTAETDTLALVTGRGNTTQTKLGLGQTGSPALNAQLVVDQTGGTNAGSSGDAIAAYASSVNSALYAEQQGGGYAGYFSGDISIGNASSTNTLITNGDFTTSVGWSFNAGWSYDTPNQEADHSVDGTGGLSRSLSVTSGEVYIVQFVVRDWTAGSVTPRISGAYGTTVNANGTYVQAITVTSSGSVVFAFVPTSDFRGSLDNVSIRRVTANGRPGEIRLAELSSNGSEYAGFKAPDALGSNLLWTLPTTQPGATAFLKSDTNGNLSWDTNAYGTGTVTSVGAGTPGTQSVTSGLTFSPNPITGAGTIALSNTSVAAGTYGDATNVPRLTVDAQGRITNASNIAITATDAFTVKTSATDTTAGFLSAELVGGNGLTFAETGSGDTQGTFAVKLNATGPGLQAETDGLSLLRTCATDEILKYSTSGWICSADATGGSGTISGSGVAGQATFWNGSNTVGGDGKFIWNNSTKRLGIGGAPNEALDVIDGNIRTNQNLIIANASGTIYTSAGTSDTALNVTNAGAGRANLVVEGDVTSNTQTKVLENGATPSLFGIFDVADLSTANKTYTFPDVSGTVVLSGHTFTADVTGTLDTDGSTALAIATDAVALTTDTTGNYVADVGAGNDIDVTGTAGEGWIPSVAIQPQLDTVATISRAASNLTLQTTGASGNILLNPIGRVLVNGATDDTNYKIVTTGGGVKAESSFANQPALFVNNTNIQGYGLLVQGRSAATALTQTRGLTNVAAGATVSGTGSATGNGPTYQGRNDYWNASAGETLIVDLGSTVDDIKAVSFGTNYREDQAQVPKDYHIDYDDGTGYKSFAGAVTGNTQPSVIHYNSTPNGVDARYIRITVDATQGATPAKIAGVQVLSQAYSAQYGAQPFSIAAGGDNVILATGGNVGIGSTVPGYKLDVQGTGQFTGALKIGAYTLPNTDGTLNQVLQTNGTGTVSWGTVSGGSSQWTTTGSDIYYDTGNVAVGIAGAPATKLEVRSTTEQLRLSYDANNRLSATVSATGGVTFDATGSGAGFTLSDATSVGGRLTLSSSGITGGGLTDCDALTNKLLWDTTNKTFSCGTDQTLSGANTALSNLASVAINTSLLPGTTNNIDLGSSTKLWKTLYLGGTTDITTGTDEDLTIDLNGTGRLVFSDYNCSTFGNGGVLTVDASGVVKCDNDDGGVGGGVNSVTAGNSTITVGGTATDPTVALNLGNANTWTGAQTFNANTNFPGSGIWNTSGNVGIGQATATARLVVNNPTTLGKTGSSGDAIYTYADSSNAAISAEQAGTGYAGYFSGKVAINGGLSVGSTTSNGNQFAFTGYATLPINIGQCPEGYEYYDDDGSGWNLTDADCKQTIATGCSHYDGTRQVAVSTLSAGVSISSHTRTYSLADTQIIHPITLDGNANYVLISDWATNIQQGSDVDVILPPLSADYNVGKSIAICVGDKASETEQLVVRANPGDQINALPSNGFLTEDTVHYYAGSWECYTFVGFNNSTWGITSKAMETVGDN